MSSTVNNNTNAGAVSNGASTQFNDIEVSGATVDQLRLAQDFAKQTSYDLPQLREEVEKNNANIEQAFSAPAAKKRSVGRVLNTVSDAAVDPGRMQTLRNFFDRSALRIANPHALDSQHQGAVQSSAPSFVTQLSAHLDNLKENIQSEDAPVRAYAMLHWAASLQSSAAEFSDAKAATLVAGPLYEALLNLGSAQTLDELKSAQKSAEQTLAQLEKCVKTPNESELFAILKGEVSSVVEAKTTALALCEASLSDVELQAHPDEILTYDKAAQTATLEKALNEAIWLPDSNVQRLQTKLEPLDDTLVNLRQAARDGQTTQVCRFAAKLVGLNGNCAEQLKPLLHAAGRHEAYQLLNGRLALPQDDNLQRCLTISNSKDAVTHPQITAWSATDDDALGNLLADVFAEKTALEELHLPDTVLIDVHKGILESFAQALPAAYAEKANLTGLPACETTQQQLQDLNAAYDRLFEAVNRLMEDRRPKDVGNAAPSAQQTPAPSSSPTEKIAQGYLDMYGIAEDTPSGYMQNGLEGFAGFLNRSRNVSDVERQGLSHALNTVASLVGEPFSATIQAAAQAMSAENDITVPDVSEPLEKARCALVCAATLPADHEFVTQQIWTKSPDERVDLMARTVHESKLDPSVIADIRALVNGLASMTDRSSRMSSLSAYLNLADALRENVVFQTLVNPQGECATIVEELKKANLDDLVVFGQAFAAQPSAVTLLQLLDALSAADPQSLAGVFSALEQQSLRDQGALFELHYMKLMKHADVAFYAAHALHAMNVEGLDAYNLSPDEQSNKDFVKLVENMRDPLKSSLSSLLHEGVLSDTTGALTLAARASFNSTGLITTRAALFDAFGQTYLENSMRAFRVGLQRQQEVRSYVTESSIDALLQRFDRELAINSGMSTLTLAVANNTAEAKNEQEKTTTWFQQQIQARIDTFEFSADEQTAFNTNELLTAKKPLKYLQNLQGQEFAGALFTLKSLLLTNEDDVPDSVKKLLETNPPSPEDPRFAAEAAALNKSEHQDWHGLSNQNAADLLKQISTALEDNYKKAKLTRQDIDGLQTAIATLVTTLGQDSPTPEDIKTARLGVLNAISDKTLKHAAFVWATKLHDEKKSETDAVTKKIRDSLSELKKEPFNQFNAAFSAAMVPSLGTLGRTTLQFKNLKAPKEPVTYEKLPDNTKELFLTAFHGSVEVLAHAMNIDVKAFIKETQKDTSTTTYSVADLKFGNDALSQRIQNALRNESSLSARKLCQLAVGALVGADNVGYLEAESGNTFVKRMVKQIDGRSGKLRRSQFVKSSFDKLGAAFGNQNATTRAGDRTAAQEARRRNLIFSCLDGMLPNSSAGLQKDGKFVLFGASIGHSASVGKDGSPAQAGYAVQAQFNLSITLQDGLNISKLDDGRVRLSVVKSGGIEAAAGASIQGGGTVGTNNDQANIQVAGNLGADVNLTGAGSVGMGVTIDLSVEEASDFMYLMLNGNLQNKDLNRAILDFRAEAILAGDASATASVSTSAEQARSPNDVVRSDTTTNNDGSSTTTTTYNDGTTTRETVNGNVVTQTTDESSADFTVTQDPNFFALADNNASIKAMFSGEFSWHWESSREPHAKIKKITCTKSYGFTLGAHVESAAMRFTGNSEVYDRQWIDKKVKVSSTLTYNRNPVTSSLRSLTCSHSCHFEADDPDDSKLQKIECLLKGLGCSDSQTEEIKSSIGNRLTGLTSFDLDTSWKENYEPLNRKDAQNLQHYDVKAVQLHFRSESDTTGTLGNAVNAVATVLNNVVEVSSTQTQEHVIAIDLSRLASAAAAAANRSQATP